MDLPSVSDYCLLEKIGSGSYATVYKAFKKVRVCRTLERCGSPDERGIEREDRSECRGKACVRLFMLLMCTV